MASLWDNLADGNHTASGVKEMSSNSFTYIQVTDDDDDPEEIVELPCEENGTILLSTIQAQFPNATGLRYKNKQTGSWRGVRLADGMLYQPPDGWDDTVFHIVYPKSAKSGQKRKQEEAAEPRYDSKMSRLKAEREENNSRRFEREDSPVYDSDSNANRKHSYEYSKREDGESPIRHSEDDSPRLTREDSPARHHEGGSDIRHLIVLGLPYKATEDDMRDYFEQFGDVNFIEVKVNPESGRSRGFGFVGFVDSTVARDVLNKPQHIMMGRKIQVNLPKPKEDLSIPSKLFIGRLATGTDEHDLREYFTCFGEISDVYVPRPFRGFGFVTFATTDAVKRVMQNNHVIRGSRVNVKFAEPKDSLALLKNRDGHGPSHGPGHHGGGHYGGFGNRERDRERDRERGGPSNLHEVANALGSLAPGLNLLQTLLGGGNMR